MSRIDGLEDIADNIERAPPMPMESVRRVVATVFRADGVRAMLAKVEDFLARSQKSLYNGSISFHDALMAVFPRGKSIKVSRAAFADVDSAEKAALLLSWGATCELWCSEYEEVRRMMSSSERASAYAVTRGKGLFDAYQQPDALGIEQEGDFKTDRDKIAIEANGAVVETDDQLVTMTRQIWWVRPYVWHKELDDKASFADPVIISASADPRIGFWSDVFTALGPALNTVVYVDGAALTARRMFKTALTQLATEAQALYPNGKPKYRRGVCPTGTAYYVTFDGETVPPGPLDNAIRTALRKYGAISKVAVVCKEPQFELTVIPADGSPLY